MTTTHAQQARDYLAQADQIVTDPVMEQRFAALAQAHATLALVEQQRIANLIALVALSGNESVQESDYDEGATLSSAGMHALIEYERVQVTLGMPENGEDEVPVIRREVREGLGL